MRVPTIPPPPGGVTPLSHSAPTSVVPSSSPHQGGYQLAQPPVAQAGMPRGAEALFGVPATVPSAPPIEMITPSGYRVTQPQLADFLASPTGTRENYDTAVFHNDVLRHEAPLIAATLSQPGPHLGIPKNRWLWILELISSNASSIESLKNSACRAAPGYAGKVRDARDEGQLANALSQCFSQDNYELRQALAQIGISLNDIPDTKGYIPRQQAQAFVTWLFDHPEQIPGFREKTVTERDRRRGEINALITPEQWTDFLMSAFNADELRRHVPTAALRYMPDPYGTVPVEYYEIASTSLMFADDPQLIENVLRRLPEANSRLNWVGRWIEKRFRG